jgi:predicted ATPase/signal transduction histidine kinase
MVDQTHAVAELEGYVDLEELGESAGATLLRARQQDSGTSVVIKLLKSEYPTPEEVARLAHEHRIVEDLRLDGVVRPLRIERFKHRVGLILEDSGGSSLRSIIGPTGLDVETFLRLAIPLVRTLGHLHDADVIHKDLNPSNIVVDDTASTVQITDFGIASRLPRVHREAGRADRLEGTLPYLSPEQTGRMNRAIDHRSDFYALGATFYETLTGRPPFTTADAMELVHCHLAVRPAPPRDVNTAVPEALSEIIVKLLAKSPEDRYQSAYGLLRDLEQCQAAWREHRRIDAFPLGHHDVDSRFHVPDRLYGREAEATELTAALERAAAGSAELLLLVGGSGVGKSALVQDVLGPMVDRRGYLIRGKFDQYSRSAPYASLIDAVRELVRQLLGEPPERITTWRQEILTALAGNAAVVGDVIPDVTLITGPLPRVAELGPTETQNRLNLVFRQFIRTFARPQQPLVIFLDDLHWADVSSIRLLRTLVSDPEARHLLIIGAYRPEAVDVSGPLAAAIAALEPSVVQRVELEPLDLASVTDLVADTVRTSRDKVAALAGLVHERTAGNPFFVNQFLHSLFEDGLIGFAPDTGRWSWDLSGIRKRSVTDNVVELMAGRVAELPTATQEALRVAAVIGNTFELASLASALDRPPAETATVLGDAIRADLILPLSENHELVVEGLKLSPLYRSWGQRKIAQVESSISYRFLHDRVQQACHSMIAADELPTIHRRVGELLLDGLRTSDRDDDLFEVVAHLNAAVPAIPDDDRRLELAQLNLDAARKARASNAYDAALHNAEAGLALLSADAWNRLYDLTFRLRLMRAQALAVVGRVDEAEIEFAELLPATSPDFDRAETCDIRSEVLLIAGRPADAYAAGRAGLEQLGIGFPATRDETAKQTEALYSAFLDLSVVDRLERLSHGDEDTLLAGRLFWRAIISAYWSRPEDMPFLVGTSVDHVLRTGLNPHTGAILGYLALVLNGRGHIETAMAYAEAARRIAEGFTDPLFQARAGMMPWVTLCLKYPFEVGEHALDDAMALCFAAGDLEFVNHSMIGTYMCAHAAGRDFPTILELCERWLDFCLTFAPLEAGQARIRAAAHRRLMALEPRPGDPVPMDPEAILREYEGQGDVTDVCESLEELTRIETLFGNYSAAYAYGGRADPLVDAGAAATLLFNYLFWMDYAIAAARVGDLVTADTLLAKMRPVAEFNPDNFRSYYTLAEAERARADGDSDGAIGGYLRTIEHAGVHGYVLLEAFANELLARHFRDRGHRFALAHFQEARALYLECGARGKAIHLEEEFPELRQAAGSRGLGVSVTPTTDRGSAHLDLGTALKASLAIAGEIALDQVVDRLVAISIENAGAERGVFVSVDGENLRVEAEGVAGGEVRRHGSVPLDDQGDVVPAGLVRAAARTGEAVVQPDALVLPITRKGNVTGVLYLENTLVSGAFTPERLALLEVLSGQMAISLENARLYAHLEEKVAERTRELSDALHDVQAMQHQMVESEKLAALGGLVAGMAHEINTPVGIAVTAASHLVDRTEELRRAWQAGSMKRSTLDHFIAGVEDAGRLILTNLERSNQLVQSFKQVAVDQSSEARRSFAVREYLDDILRSLRPSMNRAPHLIDIDCDAGLSIMSYPGALAQVVTNLVMNSVVHAYDDGVSGRIRLQATAHDGGIRLRYSDDGGGIPDDMRQHIFDPFFTTRRTQGGSGLGLHIVYNLVTQRLGGTITVQSAPGQGTSFTIDIPDAGPETADA